MLISNRMKVTVERGERGRRESGLVFGAGSSTQGR